MKFHYQIQCNRYTTQFKSEQTEIKNGYFESPSVQAAKAKLSRLANTTELFSYEQSWDHNEIRVYTGKELRWRKWSEPAPSPIGDKSGKPVIWSFRYSEREFGETIYDDDSPKYGRSVDYVVSLNLFWIKEASDG